MNGQVDPILYALFSTFIQIWRWALYCQRFYGNILSALTAMAIIEENPIQEQENVEAKLWTLMLPYLPR